MCTGWALVFFPRASFLPSSDDGTLSPLENRSFMPKSWVLRRPAALYSASRPHTMMGVWPKPSLLCGLSDHSMWWAGHSSWSHQGPSRRVNVLMVLVNLLLSPLGAWAGRTSVPLPTGENLLMKNRMRSTQRSWDGNMRNGPAEILWVPGSTPVRSN